MKLLISFDSQVEADAAQVALEAEGITAKVHRASSTAYPGIVDRGVPWRVFVQPEQENQARSIVSGWLNAPHFGPGAYRSSPPARIDRNIPLPSQVAKRELATALLRWAAVITALAAFGYLALDRLELRRTVEQYETRYGALH